MALEYERVRIGVRLKEFPDVHLSVDVHKNGNKLEQSARLELLLKEGEEMAKAQGHGDAYARIKTFRRGARQLGPWKGFEMVALKPAYKDDTDAHEFYFHSLVAVHDPLQPQLDVRLDSGVKNNKTARTKPSLSDEEALALWDKLIGTIRVRQTGDAKPSNAAPPQGAIGETYRNWRHMHAARLVAMHGRRQHRRWAAAPFHARPINAARRPSWRTESFAKADWQSTKASDANGMATCRI